MVIPWFGGGRSCLTASGARGGGDSLPLFILFYWYLIVYIIFVALLLLGLFSS